MAPADMHLLLNEKEMRVVRGPRKNQFRPSIDPLFRSASAYHGSDVVGVILTGFMSDGVIGMECIKRSGGVTVVQHPGNAEFSPLPNNVIRQVAADFIEPLDEIAHVLIKLAHRPTQNSKAVPADIRQEALIVERIITNSAMTSIQDLDDVGECAAYSCPECGGGLWELSQEGTLKRFRCHSGHAYSQLSLLQSMDNALKETIWVALRSLEERRNILIQMFKGESCKVNQRWATIQEERAEEMKVHIQRLREFLAKSTLSDEEQLNSLG